ncbi:uncharacterized protein LOC117219911 [Megalopta genalis]|uniref:uncharacterized protein LOC117219911 n=1 Tax=Megalopta genalis TaxID=115081 RepID=UPI003FD33BA0
MLDAGEFERLETSLDRNKYIAVARARARFRKKVRSRDQISKISKVKMFFSDSDDFSVALTSMLTKCTGIWMHKNRSELCCRYLVLIYTIYHLSFCIVIQTIGVVTSTNDSSELLYTGLNTVTTTLSLFKLSLIFFHRKDFFTLVIHLEEKFLHSNYDAFELKLVNECKRLSAIGIGCYTLFTYATVLCFMVTPVIANIGKNESDRLLPFIIPVDLPMSMTPYFEIAFVLEFLMLYQIGVCYTCFDYFLCIINMHVAVQFRILQHRLTYLNYTNQEEISSVKIGKVSLDAAERCYAAFRHNIQHHQALISYCQKLEDVFSLIVLAEMISYSLIITLIGLQILLGAPDSGRRYTFMSFLCTEFIQLLMFTYTCDGVIQESLNVAPAIFNAPWYSMLMNKYGRMLRRDLKLVILRSRNPCCITAKGFFPISLETYTKVWTTAASYFTLLRNSIEEIDQVNNDEFFLSWLTWKSKKMYQKKFKMRAEETKDFSLFVTSFYMKVTGIWIAANPTEERRRRNAFTFTFIFLVLGLVIHSRDVYCSSAISFEDTMLALCNLFTEGLVTAKVTALYLCKKQFKELLVYLEDNFWHTNYDTNEKTFLNQCKAQCILFICSFTFFAQGTSICFLMEPCMAYFENNDFARKLLFNLHADIFVQPYIFEITFLVQIFVLFYCGIGYLCVDNFVCVVNLHVATQFRILQYRIVNVHTGNNMEKHTGTSSPIPGYYADNCYATFKDCIKQHQALIAYCQRVEQLFTFIVLGQILVFSILMCLDGYLMFLGEASTAKRVTFACHLSACTSQLLMFTYSCDCILRRSLEIAESAYSTEWPALQTNRSGKNMASDLQLVMVRSRVPCCLTAGGFFTVSLETYTRVISTAVSYFTLLRQY